MTTLQTKGSYDGAIDYMRSLLSYDSREARSMRSLLWMIGFDTWARGVAAGYVAQAFGVDLSGADYASQPYRADRGQR